MVVDITPVAAEVLAVCLLVALFLLRKLIRLRLVLEVLVEAMSLASTQEAQAAIIQVSILLSQLAAAVVVPVPVEELPHSLELAIMAALAAAVLDTMAMDRWGETLLVREQVAKEMQADMAIILQQLMVLAEVAEQAQ